MKQTKSGVKLTGITAYGSEPTFEGNFFMTSDIRGIFMYTMNLHQDKKKNNKIKYAIIFTFSIFLILLKYY